MTGASRVRGFFRGTGGVAALAALAAVAFYLLTRHTQHVFGVLPYLLILACPLGHMFMHSGRHRHDRSSHDQSDNRS